MVPIDFYEVDALLTKEEIDMRDRVRQFVDDACMPIVAGHFDQGTFPREVIPRMAAMELFGVHVDGYGCRRRNHMTYGLICRELARCDSGLRALFSVQNSLVMYPIRAFGSEDQRLRWLPGMARGEIIGCFGLSEPDCGSNPGGMQTRADADGADYVLNGRKMWITNAPMAQLVVAWAKLGDEIRGFLVPVDTPGLEVSAIRRKFAYRTSPTGLVVFRDCRVPAENLLPNTRGLKSVFECLNHARLGVAWGATGSAMACYEAARDFALHRSVFAKPIASYQLVQEQLVRMLTEVTKAQLLNYHLARLLDEERARPPQISMAKLNNVDSAMQVARLARDILGARGILADHQVIRHLCDLEAISTLEGTAGMHTLILGQDITGIAAFV